MAVSKWPRNRASDGRVADVRFVEVELPAPAAPRLVIELGGGLRILLADPADIDLAVDFVVHLRHHRKGGRR